MCCENHWKSLNQKTLTAFERAQEALRADRAARFEQWQQDLRELQAQLDRAWDTVKAGEFTPARATTTTTTITGTVTVATPERVLVTA